MLPPDRLILMESMLNIVDLPAPFGPNSPKTSPFLIEKVLFLIAAIPLYIFLRSLTSI